MKTTLRPATAGSRFSAVLASFVVMTALSACETASILPPARPDPVPQPAPPALALCIPELLSPASGAELDNGRFDPTSPVYADAIVWEFDWADCPGASGYELWLMGANASFPVIWLEDQYPITQSSFRYASCGSYITDQNRHEWRWKVRALTAGTWGEWSAERVFSVEPLNTDPPAGCS